MANHAEHFLILLQCLKDQGIHVSVAARAIDVPQPTVRAWKQRGSGPTKAHVNKLLMAFGPQLKEKAEELGILEKATLSDKASIQLRLDSAANMVEEIEVRYKKALQEKSEELEQVKKEREELKKQVSILTELIRQKLD